jgi:hypothetical protein
LSEKVDDLNKKNSEPSENKEGEESAPPQSDDGENIIASDHREISNEEDSSDGDEVGEQRFVDHIIYRHMIGEGFNQRQPSDLAPSKPVYFNIDDQVARSLADSKFAAKRQEYSIMVANAFFTLVTHDAPKDAMQALEAGNYGAAQRLFKQVCNNFEATRDMQRNMMMFLNINSDPGATSNQKSFANDILRNEFRPGVTDRRGSSRTQKKFQHYEEQCLKATLGASAKSQANRHLASGQYITSGAGAISTSSSRKAANRKPSKTGTRSKSP